MQNFPVLKHNRKPVFQDLSLSAIPGLFNAKKETPLQRCLQPHAGLRSASGPGLLGVKSTCLG